LLGELDLECVSIQADALHTQRFVSATPGAGGRLCVDRHKQPEGASSLHLHLVIEKASHPLCGNESRNQAWPSHHYHAACQTGTEHIRHALIGAGWIVEVAVGGMRDGNPFHATHLR
jgi:hypothetical protein